MDADFLDLTTKLGGVVLGFLLAQISDWWKHRWRERKLIRKSCALILFESTQNIALLKTYWNSIVSDRKSWSTLEGHYSSVSLAKTIIRRQLPQFSYVFWNSCLRDAYIGMAEDQLREAWSVIEALKQAASIQSALTANEGIAMKRASEVDNGRLAVGHMASIVEQAHFEATSSTLVDDFISLVKGILGPEAVPQEWPVQSANG